MSKYPGEYELAPGDDVYYRGRAHIHGVVAEVTPDRVGVRWDCEQDTVAPESPYNLERLPWTNPYQPSPDSEPRG